MSRIALCTAGLLFSLITVAEEGDGSVEINPIEIVEPDSDLREVYEAQIDTEFFELGGYLGYLSIEDFGTTTVTGIKGSFHATEDFFLQGNYAQADVPTSAVETLNGGVSIIVDRDYEYYNLLVGYNLFPGETFISQDLTLNSAFYVVLGAGNTNINDDNYFTLTSGAGYRIILSDWLTFNLDMRDHTFKNEISGVNKRVHNLEFTTGLTAFF